MFDDVVLVALTDKVQCLTSFMKTMAASQSAIDSFQTSVLLLQTRVGIRQQRDKELARPHKKWTQNLYRVPQTILTCFCS